MHAHPFPAPAFCLCFCAAASLSLYPVTDSCLSQRIPIHTFYPSMSLSPIAPSLCLPPSHPPPPPHRHTYTRLHSHLLSVSGWRAGVSVCEFVIMWMCKHEACVWAWVREGEKMLSLARIQAPASPSAQQMVELLTTPLWQHARMPFTAVSSGKFPTCPPSMRGHMPPHTPRFIHL